MNDPDSRKTIQQSIDACRPGADDANLPEMSALAERLQDDEQVRGWYDRTQQSDAAIARAFHDVPVPDGLSERLLAALQKDGEESAKESSSSFVDQAVTEQDDLRPTAVVAIPAARPRRWVRVASVGAIGASLVAVVCFVLFRSGDQDIAIEEQLQSDVHEWMMQACDWTDWSADPAEAPAEVCPNDPVLRADPKQWRVAETRYDSRTIIYDISRPGQHDSAYLFCIRAKGGTPAFPATMPTTPRWTTGGVAIGAWQRKGMLYVLAVKGGKAEYRKYVGPGMPII